MTSTEVVSPALVPATETSPSVSTTATSLFANPEVETKGLQYLSSGLLGAFGTPLDQIHAKLVELEKSQVSFIAKIEQQRDATQLNNELDDLLVKVSYNLSMVGSYTTKLQKIKKDMNNVSDRVNKMKKRAEKLRQKREDEERNAAQKREKELEKDRQLTAKPSKTLLEQSQPQSQAKSDTPPPTAKEPVKTEKSSSPYLQAATKKN